MTKTLAHLERLEAESIHIMREVVAEAEKPVMLYSVGKDSAVMLHLARKAFYPSPPPFPLLHVDTTWKFKAMYDRKVGGQRSGGFRHQPSESGHDSIASTCAWDGLNLRADLPLIALGQVQQFKGR
jgi:hypothetical protein